MQLLSTARCIHTSMEIKTEALPNSLFTVIEELSNECRELLPTLPGERNWDDTYLYQYQGFWFRPIIVQSIISFQRPFQAQDTDIILSTEQYPKIRYHLAQSSIIFHHQSKSIMPSQSVPIALNQPTLMILCPSWRLTSIT